MSTSGSHESVRILLVDDHELIRAALVLLLQQRPSLQIVGQASACGQAVEIAGRERPDIILLDLDLGNDDGLLCIQELLNVSPASRVIVLTGVRDTNSHLTAVRLGAMGIVAKGAKPDVILAAIEQVHSGSAWLDRTMMTRLVNEIAGSDRAKSDPDSAKLAELSAREREVVELVAAGFKNRQISERLFISETTVRHHLTSVFSKLSVTNRVELMLFAYRTGFAKPPAPPRKR
jgi:DNA-binding NarL/FixJ family response regulator